jgi:hypothetical protein
MLVGFHKFVKKKNACTRAARARMHDAASGKNKIVRARRARASYNFLKDSNPPPRGACVSMNKFRCMHEASWSSIYDIYNKVGDNGAHYDIHRERRLIAVPSLLEGVVAPHRGAPPAF